MATVNSIAVYNFLKAHYGQEYSKQQMAEELNVPISSVTGAVNAYKKKGFIVDTRSEVVELEPATETRKAKTKTVIYHTMTEEGLAFDPVAEDERRAAEKAAEKERKAAERAAAKAAKENA